MESSVSPQIFIVDGDHDNLLFLRKTVVRFRPDVRIHTFDSGEAMLEHLQRETVPDREGTTGLILINGSHLPEKDLELVAILKSDPELKCIPLIIIVGLDLEPEIHQLYELGANTVITRPPSFGNFEEVIKRICDYWFGPLKM